MPFKKGHKPYMPYAKRIEAEKKKEEAESQKLEKLTVIETPTQSTQGETLIDATNKIIDVYNKVAQSITEVDIVKMDIKEKISALQKLSYLHNATKKIRPSNLNFIKVNTTNKSATELESALLNFDSGTEEEE